MLKSKRYGKVLFSSALMQIFLLVMATVAISVVLGSQNVSAQITAPPMATFGNPIVESPGLSYASGQGLSQKLPGTASKSWFKASSNAGRTKFDYKEFASQSFTGDKTVFGTGGFGSIQSSLIQGLAWGGTVALLVQFLGPMFGLSKENTNTLSMAALVGGLGAGFVKTAAVKWFGAGRGAAQFTFGLSFIAITAIVFILMYKDTKKHIVNVQCLPWEPQLGGAKCDDCNKDPLRPCSEYRCKSLGQACDIVNKGTAKEQCVWISKGDVNSPTITPWDEPLTRDLKYTPLAPKSTRPTALGVQIIGKGENKNCLPAYTPLQFGVTTNEPAQCKWGLSSTENYTGSMYFMEEGNYYVTNHTLKFKMPSPKDQDGNTQPYFQNDGTFNYYLRCQDANGNVNVDAYVVEFCVDASPDATPPFIESTSIISGSPVRFNVGTVPLDVNVNEPAQCKWSREDKSYESMENLMKCATDASDINGNLAYPCNTNLTLVEDRAENKFYFRCRDSAENTMIESYKFTVRGSQPLNIIELKPNGTVTGSSSVVKTAIEITTDDGAEEGKAKCFYNGSLTGEYVEMSDTDSYIHRQPQDLISGNWRYDIKCVDAGGNVAESNLTY